LRIPRKTLLAALVLSLGLASSLSVQNLKPEDSPGSIFSFIGERAVYTVKWDPRWYLFFLPTMEAGEMDVQLTGMAEFNKRPTLKIVLRVRSSGTLAKLTGFKVEDQFMIYSEPETLCAAGSFIKIHEGKKRRQRELAYLPASRQLHFREINEAVSPPKLIKDIVKDNVPGCIRDPISALYWYRSEKLQQGHDRTLLIVNNDKIREASAQVKKQETIETPAGKFVAWRMETDVMKGDLFREQGQLRIWLSADERQLPIQFEAKVRMGRILGKLKSVTP
jgi:hypothetical protein